MVLGAMIRNAFTRSGMDVTNNNIAIVVHSFVFRLPGRCLLRVELSEFMFSTSFATVLAVIFFISITVNAIVVKV